MIKNRILEFLLALLFSQSAFSEVSYSVKHPNPMQESWRWVTYSDLADKGVRSIEEGSNGELWFGTGKGLYHYNGLNWTHYSKENEVLLDPIYGLHYSQSNTLYVVTTRGICHLKNNAWQTDLLFPETGVLGSEWEILNITETSDGSIWVGLYFGLVKISSKEVTLYTYPKQTEGIESSFSNVSIVNMQSVYHELESFIIYDLLEDNSRNLWLALEDGRILRIQGLDPVEPGNYTLFNEKSGLLIGRLPLLFKSSNGTIYEISQSIQGGVNQFKPGTGAWQGTALGNIFGGDNLNFSISETKDGRIWIGAFGRAFSFDGSGWKEYRAPETGIPPTRVTFLSSSEGTLWLVGHLADVYAIQYSTQQWTTYNNLIFQCESESGEQWFLNAEGNVIYYQPINKSWLRLTDEFPMSDPVKLFYDSNGLLWAIGSHENAAALAWSRAGMWNMKLFPDLCWSFHPNGFLEFSGGKLWFGANADCGDKKWGIVNYDPDAGKPSNDGAWTHYEGTDICEVAYALGETESGSLLCGYYKGLFEYDGKTTRDLHNTLNSDIIKTESMVADPKLGVWIGTRTKGVIHYINDEQWTQYTVDNGLASNSIASLVFTSDSTLWAATDKGISRYDGNEWITYALPTNFKITRGSGELIAGNNNSLWINISPIEWVRRVFFDNTYSEENSPLQSFRIIPEDKAPETAIISYDKKVHYPGNTLVNWRGADYWNSTQSENLEYSFRIDDEPWSRFSKEDNFYFISLGRGWHTLQVRARDAFMNIDPTPATVQFKVIPPVWGQVWFILMMLIFVGTIAYLFFNTYRKNMLMEEKNQEMTRNNEALTKQQEEIKEQSSKIMELLEKERENAWLNDGILAVNEIIRKSKDNLQELAQKVLHKLIEYLELNAGVVMLLNETNLAEGETGSMEIIAAYVQSRERLEHKKIMTNEGLVGACFREKKTMLFDDIPDNRKISSGLGEAKVFTLALVPLKLQDAVVGIIELSSLKQMDEKKIRLVETVSENIASNIITLRSHQKIQEMYTTSQEQAARLHEQEEEMRQQMEELHATQEESQRREQELEKQIKDYEAQLTKLKRKN